MRPLRKTERTVNWNVYIIGFVIAALLFGVGFWFGLQVQKSVSEEVLQNIDRTRGKMIALETMLISEGSPALCEFFSGEMANFDAETYELGRQIGYMEEQRGVEPELKIEYMTLEFRDYLLVKSIKERCGGNSSLILYFLSSEGCPDCLRQGEELTAARRSADIRVYSFDLDVNSSLVNALRNSFNVTEYPTIVIDGKTYSGFMDRNQILAAVQ